MKSLVERVTNEGSALESYCEQDISAVVQALESHLRLGEEEPQALSPEQIQSLLCEATEDLRSPRQARQQWRRERLVITALFVLADQGRIQLSGRVRLTRLSRRCILDPLDPDLRLPSVHRAWQQALVQRLAEGSKTLTHLAWEALGALLLFGGCWSDDTVQRLWSLRRTDYDPATGLISLVDPSTGDPWLRWYLHPVQQIALDRLIRVRPTAVFLFPRLHSQPEAQFLDWFQELTSSTPPASICEIMTTTARWMLEIYPPYLVALAAGRFYSPTTKPTGADARGPGASPVVSAVEQEFRQQARECIRRFLTRRFSPSARRDFLDHWREVCQQMLPASGAVGIGSSRLDNLHRLTKAVAQCAAETNAGRTVLCVWDCGCMLIDRLVYRSVIWVSFVDVDRCCAGLLPTTRQAIREVLTLMRVAIPAPPGPVAPRANTSRVRAVHGRAPSYIPSQSDYERIRHEARAGRRYNRETLQTYCDLLALGMRKEEAIDLCLRHFDTEGRPEVLIPGMKSAAAHRRLPLWRHPNQDVAMRIVAAVAAARENQQRSDRHLLLDVNGQPFVRDRHPDSPTDTSIERLDHGLTTAARRALLKLGVSPHALRHGSVSLGILQGLPLEWLSQFHGHAELRTTLEHYVHSAAERQCALLEAALGAGHEVWMALARAPGLLNISKQAAYQAFRRLRVVQTEAAITAGALCARAAAGQYYVAASVLANHLRAAAKRGPRRQQGRTR